MIDGETLLGIDKLQKVIEMDSLKGKGVLYIR